MVDNVSIPLTYENFRSLRKSKNVLGMFTDNSCDEHFKFYHANKIMFSSTEEGRLFTQGLAIRGGAIGGYYFRRVIPGIQFESDLEFKRRDYAIGLKVYSNDTCGGSCSGLSYNGAIVFPKTKLSEGVMELFDLIREQSGSEIVKELSDEELAQVHKLIIEDLRTQKHTESARIRGMELDDKWDKVFNKFYKTFILC